MKDLDGEGNAIDNCPVCSNPAAATFEEKAQHGLLLGGEYWNCAWCGKYHPILPDAPVSYAGWCDAICHEAHRKANPMCQWFNGWVAIEETLPGGRYDGIWENSGFKLDFGKGDMS